MGLWPWLLYNRFYFLSGVYCIEGTKVKHMSKILLDFRSLPHLCRPPRCAISLTLPRSPGISVIPYDAVTAYSAPSSTSCFSASIQISSSFLLFLVSAISVPSALYPSSLPRGPLSQSVFILPRGTIPVKPDDYPVQSVSAAISSSLARTTKASVHYEAFG